MGVSITYGSSLSALQFADQNNTKIVLNKLSFPLEFEDDITKEAYALLYTKLMLHGRTIGGDSVTNSRISDDYLFVVCKSNIVNKLEYENLFIFCDENISGLPETKEVVGLYEVLDYMKPITLLAKEEKTVIKTGDQFVSEINVVKRHRTSPVHVYVKSSLDEKQLSDFDYSDTMAKFKSEHVLKEHGFIGTAVGARRPSVALETVHREIHKKMDHYHETEKIKFLYGS